MVRENVPLATLTTLRVGGTARFVYECDTIESVQAAVTHARDRGLRIYPLGQGSNLLAGDEPIDVAILLMQIPGTEFIEKEGGIEAIVGAGVAWDAFVHECAARSLWGVENLAGIPGTVGAAPVQNVGAYGAETADTLLWVDCYDTVTGTHMRISAADCGFGYRESRFKKEPNLIITRVAFRLNPAGAPNIAYADLARLTVPLTTPAEIGEAVRGVRSKKFPDLAVYGSAGSFFKNPVISDGAYAALRERYPELPGFTTSEGTKVPLAWILDRVLDLRGFRIDHAWLFENQPLVLVTEGGATAQQVDALAQSVAEQVFAATGIRIEREVRSLS